MQFYFEIIRRTRENFLALIAALPLEEVNRVPANFNNNIAWHLGHIVASQQVLCYKLAGLEPGIDPLMLPKYGRGSRPGSPISEEEYELLKTLTITTANELEDDYHNGKFESYTPYTTSYGIALETIDDAIRFVGIHEGVHYGYIMALKRAVS